MNNQGGGSISLVWRDVACRVCRVVELGESENPKKRKVEFPKSQSGIMEKVKMGIR